MKYPKWFLRNAAFASILYVLQYMFLVLLFAPSEFKYNVIDAIYYQAEAVMFAIVFYSFYKRFNNLPILDHLVFRIAFIISIMRLINQTLDTFQIIHIGNIYLIILEFVTLFLCTLLITSKHLSTPSF